MQIPVIFCCFIVFTFWLRYELRKNKQKPTKENQSFWEREQEANFIPKKDISNLDYIQVPLDSFPFCESTEDDKLKDLQEKVREGADKKMLNLTGYTNTDLKFTYGTANYPFLAEYDQNFTVFIRNLFAWAKYLKETGRTQDAVTLLEFGVACHSDITGNYTLLGSIYLEQNNFDAFQNLLKQANEIPGSQRESIVGKLSAMLRTFS